MSAVWHLADWPAPANVVAGFTLRHGGVSSGAFESLNLAAHVGDTAVAVAENRRRFVAACGLPADPLWLDQVHGVRVATENDHRAAADAIVSKSANVVCVVQTADCLPVLMAAADGGEIAAAHAGWRGLADGVLEATLGAMVTPADQVLAWLGPAISAAAFEVGDEVRARFLHGDREAAASFTANPAGRWQADLYDLARRRLRLAGVTDIAGGNRCTFSEPDAFFSYRRDGECGRMASFIYRH